MADRPNVPDLVFFAYYGAWTCGLLSALFALVALIMAPHAAEAAPVILCVFAGGLIALAYHAALGWTLRNRHAWGPLLLMGWFALGLAPDFLVGILAGDLSRFPAEVAVAGALALFCARQLQKEDARAWFAPRWRRRPDVTSSGGGKR